MVLEKEVEKALEQPSGSPDLFINVFTKMYDYIFSENSSRVTVSGEPIGSGKYVYIDDGIMATPYKVSDLIQQVEINEIREELNSFKKTKKQGKKLC